MKKIVAVIKTNFGTQIDRQKYINGNFMKNITKILLILILANINLFAEFKNGDGSAQNPYEIWTLEDLIKVSDFPDKHFIQKANIRKPLTYPLCVNPKSPYMSEYVFTGSYNGNGYKITLAMKFWLDTNNHDDPLKYYLSDVALFSEIGGNAIIKNVVVDGFVDAPYRAAGIVSYAHKDGDIQLINNVNLAKTTGRLAAGVFCITSASGILDKNLNLGRAEGTFEWGGGFWLVSKSLLQH